MNQLNPNVKFFPAGDELLRKLNKRFTVIGNIRGKCKVRDSHGGKLYTFGEFRKAFKELPLVWAGIDERGELILRPMAEWWLYQPGRRQI